VREERKSRAILGRLVTAEMGRGRTKKKLRKLMRVKETNRDTSIVSCRAPNRSMQMGGGFSIGAKKREKKRLKEGPRLL